MHHWYNWIPVALIVAALVWFLARPVKVRDEPAPHRDPPGRPVTKRVRRRKPK